MNNKHNLKTIREKYKNGTILKAEYISQMHTIHDFLFEYAQLLSQTDVQKIEIDSSGVYFTSKHRSLTYMGEGPKFILDPKDERIAPVEIFNFGSYEFADFNMIKNLMRDGQVVLDIGANVGFHSISLGLEFKNSTFYAFEPIPKTYNYLNKNIEINKVKNVVPFNFGFSDEEKDLTFFFYDQGSGNASSVNVSERGDAQQVNCKVTTVDKFILSNNLNVDFIKCDVEGAEFFVFKGAEELLKKCTPIVFVEILRKWSRKFNCDPNDIFNYFYKLGYKAFTAVPGGAGDKLVEFSVMTEETVETNFFFIHASKINTIVPENFIL